MSCNGHCIHSTASGVKCRPMVTENGHSERGNPVTLSREVRRVSRLTCRKRDRRRMVQEAKALL